MDLVEFDQTENDRAVLKQYSQTIEPPNCYVEIGVHQGGSLQWAVDNVKEGVEIFGIDILDVFKLKHTLRDNFIHQSSLTASCNWQKPIGLLFIDADHEEALADFRLWRDLVVDGGYVLFHDYALHSPTVIKNCDYIVQNYPEFKKLENPNLLINSSIFILQKWLK